MRRDAIETVVAHPINPKIARLIWDLVQLSEDRRFNDRFIVRLRNAYAESVVGDIVRVASPEGHVCVSSQVGRELIRLIDQLIGEVDMIGPCTTPLLSLRYEPRAKVSYDAKVVATSSQSKVKVRVDGLRHIDNGGIGQHELWQCDLAQSFP